MNIAVFGKCMENIRKRLEILLRMMQKTNIRMDKPIAVGIAILDLSKVVMCEYYYNFLKKKFRAKIRLAQNYTKCTPLSRIKWL